MRPLHNENPIVFSGSYSMKITKDEVRHISLLSRLLFSDEEIEVFSKDLNSILEYVSKISELNTEDVEPTSHVVPLMNIMRDDVVKTSLTIDKVLQNAPDKEDECFKVPKIIQ
jgi:aspartyl-tRNA(Asn)/glutamyl-tRNA(Gln) amidotransferase subunit C